MAHQTHAIPWNVLASNLKLRKVCKCQRDCTNLHPRFKPTQGKEITYFVEAFVRNIESHAQTERAKFPAFDPPSEDDILIDEALARKISPTIHLSCIDFGYGDDFPEEGFKCPGVVRRGTGPASVFASPGWDGKCRCLLPESERKAGAFLRRYQSNDCYRFFDVNKSAFFNLEVVKALLLYGEMEPVLRVCAHEFNDLASWWSVAQCYCSGPDAGLEQLVEMALLAYITLNVAYCFPETWDPALGKTEETDYRRTKSYQHMLRNCTMGGMTSETGTHPHRRFFGITDDQFHEWPTLRDKKRWIYLAKDPNMMRDTEFPHGLMSIDDLLVSETLVGFQPSRDDVAEVRWVLSQKGLPTELAMNIMELAGYDKGTRRLKVPHDPLHWDNRDELASYLKYCWQLIVRIAMVGKAIDYKIHWKKLVGETIIALWGCRGCPEYKGKWYDWQYIDGESRLEFK